MDLNFSVRVRAHERRVTAWNAAFTVQRNDEEFFSKIVASNMEVFKFQQFNTETLCDFSNVILLTE